MKNDSFSKSGAQSIAPITEAPEALAMLAAKINEIITALGASAGGLAVAPPLRLVHAESGLPQLSIDIAQLSKLLRLEPQSPLGGGGGAGAGGSGIPAGYREQTVTLCQSGTATDLTFLVKN